MTLKALSREIKFRAWDTYTKQFVIGWYLDSNSSIYKCGRDVEDYEETKDIILCQFTGLHDKNGKEIYEGDIVAKDEAMFWNPETKKQDRPVTEKQEVKWNGYSYFPFTNRYDDIPWYGEQVTIVGNIYENPELLTKENK